MLLVRQVIYIFEMHGSYKDNIWTPTSDETKQKAIAVALTRYN